MRSYEAVFGDLDGRRLVCVKRHIIKAFWKDGFYFCTYRPNWPGQKALHERDVDNKKVYPFSYLQITPMKGRFFYRLFQGEELGKVKLVAENPWLGFMAVCCTPMIRCGKWSAHFRKSRSRNTFVQVDQWQNTVTVEAGVDLLAALCIAYVFDRVQCQPLVTVFGETDEELEQDDASIESEEDKHDGVELQNMPQLSSPERTMSSQAKRTPSDLDDPEQFHPSHAMESDFDENPFRPEDAAASVSNHSSSHPPEII